MAKYRLLISIEMEEDEENEEGLIENAKCFLSDLEIAQTYYSKSTKVTLVRDGDRSEGNLLLPRLGGNHLQNKRAKLLDVLGD